MRKLFLTALILISSLMLIGCNSDGEYTVKIIKIGEGEVFKDGVEVETFKSDASNHVVLTAKAKEGYYISGWYQFGEIKSKENTYEFDVEDDDVLITVIFSKKLEKVETLEDMLDSLYISENIYDSFTLPTIEEESVKTVWNSSSALIQINGNVAQVTREEDDVKAVIKVELTKGDEKATREFAVTIKSLESKPLEYISIKEAHKSAISNCTIQGTVIAVNERGFLLKDDTGCMQVYLGKNHSYTVGDLLKVKGDITTFASARQIGANINVSILSHEEIESEKASEANSDYLESYLDNKDEKLVGDYVIIRGTYEYTGTYYNISVSNLSNTIVSMTYPESKVINEITPGSEVIVEGYLTGVLSSTTNYIQMMVTKAYDKPSTTDENVDKITVFAINDLHGVIFPTTRSSGISVIGEYIKEKSNDLSVVISAGDMFQGTALSSMTRGKTLVEIMNEIKFDAMTIGNHEFDWGIDEILKYQDNDIDNVEANFSFLAANIEDINTKELASWATPYIVIERGDYKIGVIGVLGEDQTNDILASHVKDYDFTDPYTAIRKYTKILREDEKCDIVIASCHLDTSSFNQRLANQTGEYKVDAIINGHTHQSYYGEILNEGRAPLPYVQSGSYGQYLGVIEIYIDKRNKEVIDTSANNIPTNSFTCEESKEINSIINQYDAEIKKSEEVLGTSNETIYQSAGASWAANTLKSSQNMQIGVVNSGGIRGLGFPINKNDTITYGDIFEIVPFENLVVTVTLTGEQLLSFIDYSGLYFSDNVDVGKKTVDGKSINKTTLYSVATIDYLYEKDYYPFLKGTNINVTNLIFRDVLANDVIEKVKSTGYFYTK